MKPLSEHTSEWLRIACAVTILLAFLFMVYAAVFLDIEGREIVVLLIGIVTGNMGTMFNAQFGTSRGSEEKTRMMAQRMKTDEEK